MILHTRVWLRFLGDVATVVHEEIGWGLVVLLWLAGSLVAYWALIAAGATS